MLHFFSQCSSSSSLSAQLLLLGLHFFTLLLLSVFDFFFYYLNFSLSAQFLLLSAQSFLSVPSFFVSLWSTSSLSVQLLLSLLNFYSQCWSSLLIARVLVWSPQAAHHTVIVNSKHFAFIFLCVFIFLCTPSPCTFPSTLPCLWSSFPSLSACSAGC